MMKKASELSVKELGAYIDQSVLKPDFTEAEIRQYIQEGIDYHCATVCVNPSSLDIAAEMTAGTDTKICVVCDFPFGTSTTASKVLQAETYCQREDIYDLDIVANFGWLRSGKYEEVTRELRVITEACHAHGTAVKVILETDTLNEEQIRQGCECAIAAEADFVKTSTGFITGYEGKGATNEVIRLMMDQCDGRIKIKGSGGIRTREHFLELIDMGIDRMGIGFKSTPVVLGIEK